MRYRPRKRVASFRNLALQACRTKCLSKTGPRLLEMTSRYGAFVYKGHTFHHDGHVGLIPTLDTNLVSKQDRETIDHLWFLYTEWEKLQHSLVQHLNQCRTMADVHLLMPDEIVEELPAAVAEERTLPKEQFEEFKKGTVFTMLETLMFTNEILEQ